MFTNNLNNTDTISIEQHMEDIHNYETVSTEGLFDFIQQMSHKIFNRESYLKWDSDRPYKEAMGNATKAYRIINSENGMRFNATMVVVPEGFKKGKISDLVNDLAISYQGVSEDLFDLISKVNQDLSSSVNNEDGANISTPISFIPAMKLKNKREVFQKKLSSYFDHRTSPERMLLVDLIAGPKQLKQLHDSCQSLEGSLSATKITTINNEVEKLDVTLKAYISKTEGLKGNVATKRSAKEISEALYELAKSLEFCGYVHTYALQVYKTTQVINTAIVG